MRQLGREELGSADTPDICTPTEGAPELGGCLGHNTRHKKTIIQQSAPVRVLHLVRFAWNRERQEAEKINIPVTFESVYPPLTGTAPYDLRAILEHQGTRHIRSTQAGHYVAYVRAHDSKLYFAMTVQRLA